MELLAGLLLLGPLFWITAAVFVSVMIFSYSIERYSWTGVAVIVGVAVLSLISKFPLLDFLKDNARDIILGILAYVAVGAVYSAIRFTIYMFEISAKLTRYCEDKGYKRSSMTESQLNNFKSLVGVNHIPLRVGDHRVLMMAWAVYWPLSAFWTLTHKPIRWMVETCQRVVSALLQKVSDRAFGDIVVVKDEPMNVKDGSWR